MRTAHGRSLRGPEYGRAARFATLVVLIATATARSGYAAEKTVALVHPADGDGVVAEVTTRLRAELATAGFGVEEVLAESGSEPAEQVAAAGFSPPPDATLAVTGDDEDVGVDVFFADPKTHEAVSRHVDMPQVVRQRAPAALAVRAVELLRASLLGAPTSETPTAPLPRKVSPRRTSGAETDSQRRPLLFAGELGAGMLYAGHGISPSFAPLLRAQFGTATWAGRLNVLAPAFGGEASAKGGRATLSEELVSLDVTVTLPARGPVAFVGSAGAGAYHWYVSGKGIAPNVGHDGERWGAVADFGAGALFRFGRHFGLLLDAQGVIFAPPVTVRITGTEAGKSGEPTLCTTLGFWVTS